MIACIHSKKLLNLYHFPEIVCVFLTTYLLVPVCDEPKYFARYGENTS
jgi:hypothetical protein